MTTFIKRNFILILSVLYILSPIDFLPEFLLGPLGVVDDAAVLAGIAVTTFLKNRKDQKRGKK